MVRSAFQILILAAACVSAALAQSPENSAAVYLYGGSDRSARLADAARKEGTLVPSAFL